jgi:hypothetical protein
MRSEVLSKISSTIDDSLLLTGIVFSQRTKGSSTTLNQLVVGSIIESHKVYDCAIFAFKSVRAYKVNT